MKKIVGPHERHTAVHTIMRLVRRGVPSPAARTIRALGTAILTPIVWTYSTGNLRSALAGKAVDREGRPLPWYTFPAIDFLVPADFSTSRVLEIGAGQSTLWWAVRSREVISLEGDQDWLAYVAAHLPSNAHVILALGQASHVLERVAGQFDVIVIDGLVRQDYAAQVLPFLKPGGIVIVDNSEGYWGGDATGTYPIIEHFYQAGLMRVDFYGFAPGVFSRTCTSIFFDPDSSLFRSPLAPVHM